MQMKVGRAYDIFYRGGTFPRGVPRTVMMLEDKGNTVGTWDFEQGGYRTFTKSNIEARIEIPGGDAVNIDQNAMPGHTPSSLKRVYQRDGWRVGTYQGRLFAVKNRPRLYAANSSRSIARDYQTLSFSNRAGRTVTLNYKDSSPHEFFVEDHEGHRSGFGDLDSLVVALSRLSENL